MAGGDFLQECSTKTKQYVWRHRMTGLWESWVCTKHRSLQWLEVRWGEVHPWAGSKGAEGEAGKTITDGEEGSWGSSTWVPAWGGHQGPGKIVAGYRQLTQRNGDGQRGNAERFCKEELSWVPSRSWCLQRNGCTVRGREPTSRLLQNWRWDWGKTDGGQEQLWESPTCSPVLSTGVSR